MLIGSKGRIYKVMLLNEMYEISKKWKASAPFSGIDRKGVFDNCMLNML